MEGEHKMPNGMMMSDAEMKKMMAEKKMNRKSRTYSSKAVKQARKMVERM